MNKVERGDERKMMQEQILNRAEADGYSKETAVKRIEELTAYALENCGLRLTDAKRMAFEWLEEELAEFEFIG